MIKSENGTFRNWAVSHKMSLRQHRALEIKGYVLNVSRGNTMLYVSPGTRHNKLVYKDTGKNKKLKN